MRFALSVLGPALFSALPLIGGATAVVLAPAPVHAQQGDDDPNLEELEEQVLRQQIEQYLNEFARWDEQKRRVVIGRPGREDEAEKAKSELGALAPIGEMLLQRMIERGEDDRLKIKDSMRLRPFAKIIQDYIAEGGIEDIERFQRYRNGDGENPFKGGIPPRAQKAVTALLKALNDQGSGAKKPQPRAGEGARDGERRRADEEREAESERDGQDRQPKLFERRPTERAEARRPGAGAERAMPAPEESDRFQAMKERIAKRFDMEPEEVDELLRYVREMTDQGREEMSRVRDEMRARVEEFRSSERGREMQDRVARLQRRAEDELRRFLESDETRRRLSDLEQKAMDFLASEEGQQMQRKILEFLASEDGEKLREKLGEFMASDRGRELLKQLGERFGGGKPQPKTAPRREERRAVERKAEPETPAETERKADGERKAEAGRRRDRRQPAEF